MTEVAVGAPGLYLRGYESTETLAIPTAVAGFVGATAQDVMAVVQFLLGVVSAVNLG